MEQYYESKESESLQGTWDLLLKFLEETSQYIGKITPYIPRYWAETVLSCLKKMKESDPDIKFMTVTRYSFKLYVSHTPNDKVKDEVDKVYHAACNKLDSIILGRLLFYHNKR
jgi:hypothetical protein